MDRPITRILEKTMNLAIKGIYIYIYIYIEREREREREREGEKIKMENCGITAERRWLVWIMMYGRGW